jgi:alkylation response protein AidB-like acyl-CoA dehydrogenase
MADTANRPRISFSDEQSQLLEIAAQFARDKFPLSAARARIAAKEDLSDEIWNEMAALGWLGVAIPEAFGGSGLSLAEVVTIVEPLGRQVAGTPLISTTLLAQALLLAGTEVQQKAWLPKLAEGTIGALALCEPGGDWSLTNLSATATKTANGLALSGVKTFVTDAALAELMLISVLYDGRPVLLLLDRSRFSKGRIERETVIDETRRSYRVTLDGMMAEPADILETAKTPAAFRFLDEGACLFAAAEMCGGAAGVIATTVDYLKTRKQFGRLIGSYQALKHPMVDALVMLDAARSHLYYAAGVIGQDAEGEIAVRMAKAAAGEALAFAADRSIQFHGGFGFTYDCDAQLYRRLGLWGEARYGDAAWQRARLAQLLL